MIKSFSYLFFVILISSFYLSNCSKGPRVKDIVQGVYEASKKKNNYKSKKIKILTGDTLHTISRRYKITIKELINFNSIKSPYILKPGMYIKVPSAKKYQIKKGDTLFKIANCHNIEVKDINIKNIKLKEKKLMVGRKINLPYFVLNKCRFKNRNTKVVKSNTQLIKEIFIWPTKGNIVSNFGKQKGGRRNDGINILAAKGNPVRAALNGKVIYRGNELPAWGNLILIKHKNNWTTAYAHLEKFLVTNGENVKTGDIIGSVGSTGNVTRNQLHFQVRNKSKPLNPIKYLKYLK